ncbi:helix-turn-helix domain-containing protein [Acidovorax sp. Q11]
MPINRTEATSIPSSVQVNIGILWGRDSIASVAAAVADALRAMNMLAAMRASGAQGPMRWHWLLAPGEEGAAPPPLCDSGALLGPLHAIVIPGWLVPTGPQLREVSSRHAQHFGAVLRAHVAGGGAVAALFNGSSLLADCGLLAERKVALPWAFAPSTLLQSGASVQAKEQGPPPPAGAVWQREQPWQRDGPIWTSAAPQHTLPVVLDLLAQTPAAELAQAASHVLLFDAPRQLTATATLETPTGAPMGAGSLEQARRWLRDHRNEPYNLKATARAATTSPRTLLRWFAQVYGESPQDYLHNLRIAQAQALLQTTYLTVDAVAQQCGYSDTGSFRKIFHRVSGTTPGAYRQRFKLRTTRKQWLGTHTNGDN